MPCLSHGLLDLGPGLCRASLQVTWHNGGNLGSLPLPLLASGLGQRWVHAGAEHCLWFAPCKQRPQRPTAFSMEHVPTGRFLQTLVGLNFHTSSSQDLLDESHNTVTVIRVAWWV